MSQGLSSRDAELERVVQAGGVHIILSREAAGGLRAEVRNFRITGALPALTGRPVDALPQAMARLFPMCGLAHEIVVRRALEAAVRGRPDGGTESHRERCLLAESAVTQIWRALIDWPRTLGRSDVDLRVLRNARRLFARVWGSGRLERGQAMELADNLACVLFPGAEHRPPDTVEALLSYLRSAETPGAALVRAATRTQEAVQPRAMPTLLDRPSPAWFAGQMLSMPDFGARPEVDGRPAECGALSRLAQTEQERLWHEGPLAARLLAMQLQGSLTVATLRNADAGRAGDQCEDPAAPAWHGETGWGAGVAETARGPLACLLRVTQSETGARCVGDIRLCAPSEWCLHPDGAMARLLGGITGESLELAAGLAVAAFDPCADVFIDVRRGGREPTQAGECS